MSALDDMIDAMRRLGRLPEDVARVGAPLVEKALRATAAAGTDPDGHPWPPTKDGRRALVHSPQHITAAAHGPVIRATLRGVDVYHDKGAGVPRRQILPDPGTIPPGVGRALERAAELAFGEALR